MSDTIHTVARRMAKAGRLPGLDADHPTGVWKGCIPASDADIAWAAIQYADDQTWAIEIGLGAVVISYVNPMETRFKVCEHGTTALSVLLAVERACEASKEAT